MSHSQTGNVFWAVAAACLLAGAGLSIQSVRIIREAELRVARKLGDLEKLRAIEKDVRRGEVARQTIEKRPAGSAEPLLPLVQGMFAGYRDEDCRETRRDLMPGWIVRQTEVSFNEVAFESVMEFVRRSEALRPPWLLVKFSLGASSSGPGTGHATLYLEAVQRRE